MIMRQLNWSVCERQVLEMERNVLNHLHFELTGPTTKSFLRYVLPDDKVFLNSMDKIMKYDHFFLN